MLRHRASIAFCEGILPSDFESPCPARRQAERGRERGETLPPRAARAYTAVMGPQA